MMLGLHFTGLFHVILDNAKRMFYTYPSTIEFFDTFHQENQSALKNFELLSKLLFDSIVADKIMKLSSKRTFYFTE